MTIWYQRGTLTRQIYRINDAPHRDSPGMLQASRDRRAPTPGYDCPINDQVDAGVSEDQSSGITPDVASQLFDELARSTGQSID